MVSGTTSIVSFTAAATVLTITPGLDTALVLRTAATEGARPAALAAVGIALGCFSWASAVAFGLGALLAASVFAYSALRWIGAAYLVWLGYKMLRYPRHTAPVAGQAKDGGRGAFSKGLLTNLLNPKVGIFYVSFLPQFVPDGVRLAPYILILGAIHATLGLLWFACLIGAIRPLAQFLDQTAVIKAMDRLTGGVFLTFGIGLALQSRRP